MELREQALRRLQRGPGRGGPSAAPLEVGPGQQGPAQVDPHAEVAAHLLGAVEQDQRALDVAARTEHLGLGAVELGADAVGAEPAVDGAARGSRAPRRPRRGRPSATRAETSSGCQRLTVGSPIPWVASIVADPFERGARGLRPRRSGAGPGRAPAGAAGGSGCRRPPPPPATPRSATVRARSRSPPASSATPVMNQPVCGSRSNSSAVRAARAAYAIASAQRPSRLPTSTRQRSRWTWSIPAPRSTWASIARKADQASSSRSS